MQYDVVQVRALEHLKLEVRFADGLQGTVTLRPSHLYGIVEPLKDPQLFSQVRCDEGFVSWPADIDLAPDAIYEAIRQQGTWILS